VLASYIAGGYMVGKDEPNEALDAAKLISFDDIEKEQLEEFARAAKAIPLEDTVKAGSFERLTGLISGARTGFH
jgi:hypothetical protein